MDKRKYEHSRFLWGQEYEYTVEGNKDELCSKGNPTYNDHICYNKIGRKANSYPRGFLDYDFVPLRGETELE